jgi:hypothetical protein
LHKSNIERQHRPIFDQPPADWIYDRDNTYGHHHPDHLQGAAHAIGQKGRYVSVAETVVSLTEDRNQKKNSNDFWSEWQDSNLRPLRPERSALPG